MRSSKSSSSSSERERSHSRRGRHGRKGRRGPSRGEVCQEMCGFERGHMFHRMMFGRCKELKNEIKIAVTILCRDMKPFHQTVVIHLVKKALKKQLREERGKCKEVPSGEEIKEQPYEEHHKERHHGGHYKGKHHGEGHHKWRHERRREEDFHLTEMVKKAVKKVLENKDKLVETIDTIMEIFDCERKEMMSQTAQTKESEKESCDKECRDKHHMYGHRRFAKEVAKLIMKMHKKGITKKEDQQEMAKKFIRKIRKGHMKDMKKAAKEVIKKILCYELEGCDPLYRKAVQKTITKAFVKHCFIKLSIKREKMHKMMKEFEERSEGRPEGEPGGPRDPGMRPPHHMGGPRGHFMGGPMGHHMMGFGMGRHMMGPPSPRMGMMCGPHMMRGMGKFRKKMFMKTMFIGFMMKKGMKFVLEYYKKNEEAIKTCYDTVKELVVAYFKDMKQDDKCVMKAMRRVMADIVSGAIYEAGDEKKSKEFFINYAKKYIKGLLCPCKKKCIRKCKHLVKAGLLFNGVKDECVLHIASRWGAIACCQKNGKDGCPESVCAEFTTRWVSDHVPIVTQALEVAKEMKEEMMKECKEECPKKCGDKVKDRFMCKMIFKYLAMNCTDGKFDKEQFKAYIKEFKERMKKEREQMEKKFQEKQKKHEEKK